MNRLKGVLKKLDKTWFWLGLAAVAVMAVPYLLLGEDAVFTYHDQLDGEMIAYILQAKHLFSGSTLPEFLGGVSKTALTMPAPGFVLLFLTGNYFAALLVMQLCGSLTGYAGMYLLLRDRGTLPVIAAMVGVCFAYLPFLPVYGLSQYGIPLLFWCVLQLKDNRRKKTAFLYFAIYGMTSSLVLVGFGLLGMGILWLFWLVWKERERAGTFLAAWLMLLGIYVAENGRLLGELLGIGGAEVSHKAEYVLQPEGFWSGIRQGLLFGGQHSQDYHKLFLPVILVMVLAGFFVQTEKIKRLQKTICGCFLWNLLFVAAAAFWDSGAGVFLRNQLAALRGFQLNRLLWIAPVFWYLAFGCSVMIGLEGIREAAGKGRRVVYGGMTFFACLAAAATGFQIFMAGDVKSNLQKLRNPDYKLLSYREYYGIGVLNQVAGYLKEETGREQQEYRVVSLGIDPAAALYHGFYCLDGYSNNYPLAYKHRFRQVLAPELEKSAYLQSYFDDWGNRCYLFSAECPGYYTIEKNGFYFQEYELDAEALKAMGGEYLLSAAYIANASEQGLRLMREEPFESTDSYYRIYVYEVEPE